MQMQKFRVVFDDGHEIETQLKSRDLARLEAAGLNIEEIPPIRGTYLLAFTALQRMSRAGLLDFDIPADVDGLLEIADIETDEDADAEGEGSGQVAVTG